MGVRVRVRRHHLVWLAASSQQAPEALSEDYLWSEVGDYLVCLASGQQRASLVCRASSQQSPGTSCTVYLWSEGGDSFVCMACSQQRPVLAFFLLGYNRRRLQ